VKRAQAHQEAHHRWGTPGTAPGDRYGVVVVRTDGGTLLHQWVLMGKGPSWEEALARADRTSGPAAAITDDQIREVLAATLSLGGRGRQNAHTRALRVDCRAALDGSRVCRERVAQVIAEHGGREYHGISILAP